MIDKISLIKKIGCECHENEPMKNHTSLKIGGNAEIVVFPNTAMQVAQIVTFANENKINLTVLGKGSNVLVSDSGLAGIVMLLDKLDNIQYLGEQKGKHILFAQAGASLTRLCRTALDYSLTGIEFAFGIPGSCGGAAFMNAGAYGGEMKDVLQKCTHIARDGSEGVLSGTDLDLAYRHSAYSDNGCIITGVFVELEKGNSDEIRLKMHDLMNRRKTKQPLEFPSAGSTFKRPEGYFAGQLIEECALKGKSVGGAMVSEKHAGFLINADCATCNDFLGLVELVKKTIKDEKNVELEMEIRVLK